MKQLGLNMFTIDALFEIQEFALNPIIKNHNLLIIVPGILETNIKDTKLVDIINKAMPYNDGSWNVLLLHNQSHGFILDTLECAAGKFLGGLGVLLQDPPEYPGRLLKSIIETLPAHQRTVILCHSQGGIISTNALNCFSKNIEIRDNIQLICFGSASWTLPKINKANIVCYSNYCDPVGYLFGRALLKSTVKFKDEKWHYIPYYANHMTEATKIIFKTNEKSLIETLKCLK